MGHFAMIIFRLRRFGVFFVALTLVIFSAMSQAQLATIPPPRVSVDSYILIDHETGSVLAEKNADKKMEPASLSKIMTTYVAADALKAGHIKLSESTIVSKKAWRMEGSRMFIEVGKRVVLDDLLNGIIVQSGNDSSVALAEHLYGSEESFVEQMNSMAEALKMTNSSFGNVTGLPDRNTFVTARDIATLSAALIREHPRIYSRFSRREFTYNNIKQRNRNALLFRDSSVDGIKTGYTERAGYCLVASAKSDSMRLISAVMGAKSNASRIKDAKILLDYGFRFFETKKIFEKEEEIASVRIWNGKSESVRAGLKTPFIVNVRKTQEDRIRFVTEFQDPLRAPIQKGEKIGIIEFYLFDEQVKTVDLFALESVEGANFFKRAYDEVKLFFR